MFRVEIKTKVLFNYVDLRTKTFDNKFILSQIDKIYINKFYNNLYIYEIIEDSLIFSPIEIDPSSTLIYTYAQFDVYGELFFPGKILLNCNIIDSTGLVLNAEYNVKGDSNINIYVYVLRKVKRDRKTINISLSSFKVNKDISEVLTFMGSEFNIYNFLMFDRMYYYNVALSHFRYIDKIKYTQNAVLNNIRYIPDPKKSKDIMSITDRDKIVARYRKNKLINFYHNAFGNKYVYDELAKYLNHALYNDVFIRTDKSKAKIFTKNMKKNTSQKLITKPNTKTTYQTIYFISDKKQIMNLMPIKSYDIIIYSGNITDINPLIKYVDVFKPITSNYSYFCIIFGQGHDNMRVLAELNLELDIVRLNAIEYIDEHYKQYKLDKEAETKYKEHFIEYITDIKEKP